MTDKQLLQWIASGGPEGIRFRCTSQRRLEALARLFAAGLIVYSINSHYNVRARVTGDGLDKIKKEIEA